MEFYFILHWMITVFCQQLETDAGIGKDSWPTMHLQLLVFLVLFFSYIIGAKLFALFTGNHNSFQQFKFPSTVT